MHFFRSREDAVAWMGEIESIAKPRYIFPTLSVVVHAILFAIYPSLFLYSKNLGEFPAASMIPLGSLVVAVAVAACVGLGALLRDRPRAAVIVSGLVTLWFTFGYAKIFGQGVVSATGLLVLWALLAVLYAGVIWRTSLEIRMLSVFLTVISSTLILLCLIDIGVETVASSRRESLTELLAPREPIAEATTRPDIYLIILDAYARADVLADLYGNDNAAFLDRLREHGFRIAERATSNYNQTRLSVASMLNLDYLDEAAKRIGLDSGDQIPLVFMVRKAKVFTFLEQQGYEVIAFAPVYLQSDMPESARFVRAEREVDVFGLALLNTTPLPELAAYWGESVAEKDEIDRHRDSIRQKLDRLADAHEISGSPKFVFVHLEAPHPPFVLTREGDERSPKRGFQYTADGDYLLRGSNMSKQEYRALYLDQLLYINGKILAAIDSILKHSATPPIIILLGDHGPRSGLVWESMELTDQRESLSTLGAYYLPGAPADLVYPELSSVNAFRIVFDQYFGTDYGVLEDRNFFSTQRLLYQFHDVTDAVRSTE